jgi:hypothetical protein
LLEGGHVLKIPGLSFFSVLLDSHLPQADKVYQ